MEVEVALVLRSVERDSKTDPRASLVMRHHRVITQRLTVSIEQVQQTMLQTSRVRKRGSFQAPTGGPLVTMWRPSS